MSEKTAEYVHKIKRAAQILFYKRHRQPGVKGWELKRALGAEYPKIVDLLNHQLNTIDLQVKIVYETPEQPKTPTGEQLERARFYVTLKEPLRISDMVLAGWRIDDVAILVVAVAYIISKQGQSQRSEVEAILREKFPKHRIDYSLNRFIRMGYLRPDDAGLLYLDWRARAEIDPQLLLKLILAEELPRTM
ncbi:MAG: hypothetical protein V1915_02895 [Candidatus Bathyarchaeota archaeon]